MTDMLGNGDTRAYFLPKVDDPAAPTPEELAAGTEITGVGGWSTADEGPEAAGELGEWISGPALERDHDPGGPRFTTVTLTIRVNERSITEIHRNLRRLVRRIERWSRNPRRAAMHADYAHRRKARARRRR